MLRMPMILVSLAGLGAVLTAVGSAMAQDPEPAQSTHVVAPPPDDLSGHVVLAPHGAFVLPMGGADSLMDQRTYIREGPAAGLDLAVGISRYVALAGRFDYGWFSAGAVCPGGQSCSARMTSFGLGLEYHLVNGGAFDPWMRAGMGVPDPDLSPAWFRRDLSRDGLAALGSWGDWYAARQLGFGPYMAFDLGVYDSRPTRREAQADSAVHTFFSIGLRAVFDLATLTWLDQIGSCAADPFCDLHSRSSF